jgi:hypothetical protein
MKIRRTQKKKNKNMHKTSGDEGCHSKNAVLRHGVFAMTGPRMLTFAYISFHVFFRGGFSVFSLTTFQGWNRILPWVKKPY